MKKLQNRFFDFLKGELNEWTTENLISYEQSQAILARYQASEKTDKAMPPQFITALLIIGSIVLGAGIIFFIASNWSLIPAFAKLVLIILVIAVAYAFGYYFKYHSDNNPRLGSALIFLGAILFGGGIFLTAQIFHIQAHYPDGVLYWFLGVIPLAWLLHSKPILGLSLLLVLIWGNIEGFAFRNINFLYPILFLGAIMPLSYKFKSKLFVFLSLVGIINWLYSGPIFQFIQSLDGYIDKLYYLIIYGYFITVGLGIIGGIHSLFTKTKFFQGVYSIFSYILLYLFYYIFSIYHVSSSLTIENYNSSFLQSVWILFFILLALGLLVILAKLFIFKMAKRIERFAGLFSVPAEHDSKIGVELGESVFFILSLFYLFPLLNYELALVSNILALLLAVGMVYLGYTYKKNSYANLGFFFFALYFVTRYIDYGYAYMDKSLFFIILGLLLIGGGIALERFRRYFIKKLEEK